LEAEHIDLGNEPPLSVDGHTGGLVDRRRVSVQWFSGTILTGLCGAALMGGAVFAALDGQTNFATVPERVEATLRAVGTIADRITNIARKTDRLPPPGESNAARTVIPVTVTSRGSGNREIMRVRPFIRVAGNLSLSVSELSASIPPFNAQKMLAHSTDNSAVAADDAADAEPDAEVSFLVRDLNTALPRAKIAAVLPTDEIIARVRDAINWDRNAGQRPPLVTDSIPSMSAYAPERHGDPYAGFEPRIVQENVTLLPKTTSQTTNAAWNERTIVLKKGDSVSAVLRDMGATPDEVKAITAAFGGRGKDTAPRDGYRLRVLPAPGTHASRLRPVRVIIATDTTIDAMVAWSDMGKYVAVDVRSANSVASSGTDDEDDGKGVRLYQSIWETALRNQVPRPVIEDVVRIYSYDVDLQRKVQPGDSFEILYASDSENAGDSSKSEVLYALLTTGGETRKFYRYQTNDDNMVDYYDESGKSAKKFLVRKPVSDGAITSGFGGRNHPLLGYTKMHTGVDWGSAMGTPIFAAGNGVIEQAGWEGGYGKYIRIHHANGYETAYGHMSAFARGMEPGKKVRQGQLIGYVGSTGLSTGAHLHYEILINGRFVDPMKIKLPRGRVLEGTLLAGFDQERRRLDGMVAPGALIANGMGPSRYAQGR
jgi:murein DD-endopeptidase MepM/ murein hydrolase activator NlpD